MPLIKRYPNRKLYDTQSKSYIKLEEIAALIRRGEAVQVVDHATGDDLTALTLAQIILEEEKKQAGFLPLQLLSNLVQAGGETMSNLHKAVIGSSGWIKQVDEEIRSRLEELVRVGEINSDEARQLLKKLLRVRARIAPPEVGKSQDEIITNILKERGVPTQAELRRLEEQIDKLGAKIEELARG